MLLTSLIYRNQLKEFYEVRMQMNNLQFEGLISKLSNCEEVRSIGHRRLKCRHDRQFSRI